MTGTEGSSDPEEMNSGPAVRFAEGTAPGSYDQEQHPGSYGEDDGSDKVINGGEDDSQSSYSDDYTSTFDSDSEWSQTSEMTGNGADDTAAAEADMMRDEARRLCWWRGVVLLGMLAAAFILITVVFNFSRRSEYRQFETEFQDVADKIVNNVPDKLSQAIRQMDSLSVSVTTYAASFNAFLPFVVVPEFDIKAENTRRLADLEIVSLVPTIGSAQRQAWETFSESNNLWVEWGMIQQQAKKNSENQTEANSGRLRARALQTSEQTEEDHEQVVKTAEGIEAQFPFMEEALEDFWNNYGKTSGTPINYTTDEAWGISKSLYRTDGVHKIVEDSEGPYNPVWQSSPVIPGLVNFNLDSHDVVGPELLSAKEAGQVLVGKFLNISAQNDPFNVLIDHAVDETDASYGPVSFIYFPVMKSLRQRDGEEPRVVAMMTSMIRWTELLKTDDLSDRAIDILAVVENDCKQAYSFSVSQDKVAYLGDGDFHDTTYDYLDASIDFERLIQDDLDGTTLTSSGVALNTEYCPFRVSVYPSVELQDEFVTFKPELISILVAAVFVVTAAIFLGYDTHVESRQRLLVGKAVTSHQIVSSLFPEVVRDRLFGVDDDKPKNGSNSADPTRPVENLETDKLRLKNYINTGGATGADGSQSKPIADLFTHCTVLFADIAGFTAWSSTREPVQVFTLLESMYSAFDKIATKRRVFKVETVGDCYMAVTGECRKPNLLEVNHGQF